jgi:hypothetical protein
MQITNLLGERFNLALDRFQKGDHLVFENASYVLKNSDSILCKYQSSWIPENVDSEKAEKDFKSAKQTFDFLKKESKKFGELVDNRDLEIILIDDYGMGVIELANFRNGEFDWRKIKE